MNTLKDDLYVGLVNYIDYEKKKSKLRLKEVQEVLKSVLEHFNIRANNDTSSS